MEPTMLSMRFFNLSQAIEDLRSAFLEEGYLFIRNFFKHREIECLRLSTLKTLTARGWAIFNEKDHRVLEPIHRIGSLEFFSCIQELIKNEEMHQLAYSNELLLLLQGLLEEDVYPHPRKMVRISYPYAMNPMDLTPAHQDIFYVRGEPDTFTVWIPLGNYSIKEGGLQVASGSHLKGLYPSRANHEGRFNCTASEIGLEFLDWRQTDFEMGDILIMHSLTLHQAVRNETNKFRISLDCRFSSKKGHINEEQLLPPYFPNIEGWNILCQNWQNPHRFALPKTIKLDSPNFPLEKVMQRPSMLTQIKV